MQKEESELLLSYRVQRYHNRTGKPLSNKRVQLLLVRRLSMAVCFEDVPEQEQDCIDYDRVAKISWFMHQKEAAVVIAVTLKKQSKPNISFRVATEQIGQQIVRTVTEKVNEIEKLPDYTDLLTKEEEVIERIQETDPEYRELWVLFHNKIDRKLLTSCLFYDHESVVEFQRLARMKGYEKERKFVMAELKERTAHRVQDEGDEGEGMQDELHREGYDLQKSLEGVRVQDDERKLKYMPTAEECEDDLFFNELPNIRQEDICEQFREIDEQPMQIESEGGRVLPMESDVRQALPLHLPRPEKGKFRISQSKQLFTGHMLSKPQRKKEEGAEVNVRQAKKIVLTLKLFYKMIRHNPLLSEVTAVEEQLNRTLNSESRPPSYLENPIRKTIATILRWKRQRHL